MRSLICRSEWEAAGAEEIEILRFTQDDKAFDCSG